MGTEAVHLRASLAEKTGDLVISTAGVRLTSAFPGTAGTLTYPPVEASEHVLWKAAEIAGIPDRSTNAVRVRLSNGIQQFYIDEDDNLEVKEVTDTSQWDTEFSRPYLLANLDLWTQRTFVLVVHLIATDEFPIPRVKGANVLMDFPAWEGAIAQAVTDIVDFVATVHPVMVERFPFSSGSVLSEPKQSFAIGKPHTEHGFELTELIQVLIDGNHKSAQLADGTITLLGPPAPAGSNVRIAVKFKPNTAVRRVGEVRFVDTTPAWVLENLVVDEGLDGRIHPIIIQGYEAYRFKVELRITVNGVAHRQKDALAMRLALQKAFAEGIQIQLPSGRCITGSLLDGVVEVIPESGTSLPMATTVIVLSVDEYVHARVVRNARTEDPVTGDITAILTQLNINLPDGVSVTITADDFDTDC